MRNPIITAVLVTLTWLWAPPVPASGLVSLEDINALRSVGRPALSPSGGHVAYALDDRIHVIALPDGKPRAVTSAASAAHSPHWSRDGSGLYFLSDRSGSSQLWRLPVDRFGEAEQLSELEGGIDSLILSPDEKALLIVRSDQAEPAEADSDAPQPPWVIDRLQFKADAGDGYLTARPSEHLYVYELATGELTQVTSGEYAETDAAWSPDAGHLVFVSNREAEPDRAYRNDLWRVPAKASGIEQLRALTADEQVKGNPAWSPDGRHIAWLNAEDGVYGQSDLMVMNADGSNPRPLAASLDRWINAFRFSGDGRFVYFTYESHGGVGLARVSVEGNELETLLDGPRVVSGFDVGNDGKIVVRLHNANDAPDLYLLDDGELSRLTDINRAWFDEHRLGDKTLVRYRVADGTEVEAFLTLPPGGGTDLPLVLKIHGGPVGQFAWGFDFGTQYLAARGYAVIEPNPRGSSGRGQDFIRAIYRTWGITDYPDVIGAVDYAVAAGIADPERLFVTGYSYGGYMTNVVITRTDRFSAAVSGAGHSYIAANYGHDMYQKWYNWEIGPPQQDREAYDRLSPFLDADKVTTPTLFAGGREDWNVPILNAELFYQALRQRGIDTRLVVYPNAHHGGWPEAYEQDYVERMADWFDAHGGPGRTGTSRD